MQRQKLNAIGAAHLLAKNAEFLVAGGASVAERLHLLLAQDDLLLWWYNCSSLSHRVDSVAPYLLVAIRCGFRGNSSSVAALHSLLCRELIGHVAHVAFCWISIVHLRVTDRTLACDADLLVGHAHRLACGGLAGELVWQLVGDVVVLRD